MSYVNVGNADIEIQFVHRVTGEVLGKSVPFSVPTRAAFVIKEGGKWREAKMPLWIAPHQNQGV